MKDQQSTSNTRKYAGETGCAEVEHRKSSTLKNLWLRNRTVLRFNLDDFQTQME